jgi:hypothetical protein
MEEEYVDAFKLMDELSLAVSVVVVDLFDS